MNKEKTSYFCVTPFQVMSAISMAYEYKEDADLYIMNQFESADILAGYIKESRIFNNVKVVDEKKEVYSKYITVENGFINHLQIANSYLYVNQIAKHILFENHNYSKMYISCRAYVPRLLMLYFIKNHFDTEIVYFDDGTGSYDNPNTYEPIKADTIIRFVLFGRKSIDTNKIRLLYCPPLYEIINPQSAITVSQIPCAWKEEKIHTLINTMFEYSEKKSIKEPVLILDTIRENWSDDNKKRIESIYEKIIKKYGNDRVLIKRHPRDKSELREGIKYYSESSIPMEVLYLNTSVSNKIIIAYSSTAVITPKMIFDEEPYVILLYKIFEPNENADSKRNVLYNSIRELYHNHDKFIIPESEAQFFGILDHLNELE